LGRGGGYRRKNEKEENKGKSSIKHHKIKAKKKTFKKEKNRWLPSERGEPRLPEKAFHKFFRPA